MIFEDMVPFSARYSSTAPVSSVKYGRAPAEGQFQLISSGPSDDEHTTSVVEARDQVPARGRAAHGQHQHHEAAPLRERPVREEDGDGVDRVGHGAVGHPR